MAQYTPSTAKNHLRRALWALLDPLPGPEEKDELWVYFASRCAYCDANVDRGTRGGHVDHIVPSSSGGTNEIYNCVLSCPQCNGDKKREMDWLEFLEESVTDTEARAKRQARISEWMKRAKRAPLQEEVRQKARIIVENAVSVVDSAVENIRQLRDGRLTPR